MRKTLRGVIAGLAYLGSIVAANWLITRYGFVPVGFGLVAPAGTYAAGLAFVARDSLQDAAGRWAVLACIAAGAGLSAAVSSPSLVVASAAAFTLSELVDMGVYTPLRRRGYLRAALASNVAGAVLDTFVFLSLAGFGLAPLLVSGQIVGKTWVTVVTVVLVIVVRSARRPRVAS